MSTDWKLEQARLDYATSTGQRIAQDAGILAPPVDPFLIIGGEEGRIRAFGDDFADDFDGRLEYQKPRFLLFYNTKYDEWTHTGQHHSKVLFTIGHELGHYFLEHHRGYLMGGGGAHGSVTEFQSPRLVEREADSFSAGLLMPEYLLRQAVNRNPPSMELVKKAAAEFHVSLTSMLIRWVQLCDFPCAIASVRDATIEWGYCSPGFKQAGAVRVRRSDAVCSRTAREFIHQDESLTAFREGEGYSDVSRWIATDELRLIVTEHYLVIPRTRQMLVFLAADEDDLYGSRDCD